MIFYDLTLYNSIDLSVFKLGFVRISANLYNNMAGSE